MTWKRRHHDEDDDDSEGAVRRAGKRGASLTGMMACSKWADELHRHGGLPKQSTVISDRATVAVIGSYNAGKSALVNAIIGEALLTSAPVEQTTVPWAVIREGTFPDLTVSQVVPNVVWTTAANAFPSLVLVDTPGYGGVDADKITLAPLIDIAQVAVLCISSQTPVTMYDVRMAEMLVRKKLRVLVVLTKADLCVDDAERSAVIASVRKRLSPALSHCPHVWAVSTSSSSKSSYELVTLTAELASLQDRSWLSKALLETALRTLEREHDATCDAIRARRDRADEDVRAVRTRIDTIDRACDGLVADMGACRHALRRQASLYDDRQDIDRDSGSALAAPVVGLRVQLGNAVDLIAREVGDDERCKEQLEKFRTATEAILKQSEAMMESVVDPEAAAVGAADDNDPNRLTRSVGVFATATLGMVAVSFAVNPIAGVVAAVAGFAGAIARDRRQHQDERERSAKLTSRRLLGEPSNVLDRVLSNIDRFRQRLKEPLLDRIAGLEMRRRDLDQTVDDVEIVKRDCRRAIAAEIAGQALQQSAGDANNRE
ncbi:unnamed protein product (mitochondrion) [Plasmodiophora brassicae]|uniref:G domain-containing protein n=1 Tax=Plasmodiophora brassicae TaxID=37360 RepID=A0A0G4ISL9_PLABS|nr:hypothetical protein PBRA_006472 [Plasmodiophora brassicae]SPQ94443.1 unnamed protein product [Plasmodiophora brassicae]